MTIMSFVLAGAYSAFYTFSKSVKVTIDHTEHSMDLQYAFESIHKALRSVSQVHTTQSSNFEFTTTNLDGTDERISLYYDSNLKRLVKKSVTDNTERTLLYNVTDVTFTYYDRFGDPTNTQIDMNAAKLDVITEREIVSGSTEVETETATVTFRNRNL